MPLLPSILSTSSRRHSPVLLPHSINSSREPTAGPYQHPAYSQWPSQSPLATLPTPPRLPPASRPTIARPAETETTPTGSADARIRPPLHPSRRRERSVFTTAGCAIRPLTGTRTPRETVSEGILTRLLRPIQAQHAQEGEPVGEILVCIAMLIGHPAPSRAHRRERYVIARTSSH